MNSMTSAIDGTAYCAAHTALGYVPGGHIIDKGLKFGLEGVINNVGPEPTFPQVFDKIDNGMKTIEQSIAGSRLSDKMFDTMKNGIPENIFKSDLNHDFNFKINNNNSLFDQSHLMDMKQPTIDFKQSELYSQSQFMHNHNQVDLFNNHNHPPDFLNNHNHPPNFLNNHNHHNPSNNHFNFFK